MDPIELYAATLGEVKRQAVQLGAAEEAGGDASGGSSSDSNGGWVVLESGSTPAQLPGAAGCSLWPQQQWAVAYEILFCQCPPEVAALRPHQDDMLFFVYTDEAAASTRSRLFVRRRQARAAALPPDLQLAGTPAGAAGSGGGVTSRSGSSTGGAGASSKAAQVDWRASVLLMVVLQTAYRLSLVTSPDADLLNAFAEDGGSVSSAAAGPLGGAATAASVHQVTQAVHPSPSRVPINLDHSRSDAGQPKESYPDICFAVDSCDHAFRSQVLRLPGDCYCVLLHADVAASWRMPAPPTSSSSGPGGGAAADAAEPGVAAVEQGMAALGLSQSSQRPSSGSLPGGSAASGSGSVHSGSMHSSLGQARQQSVVAFSGYVSHQQLTAALGGQLAGDPVRQVLRAAAAAARGKQRGGGAAEAEALATCRVSMRGPGGRGHADVAVSSFPPAGDAGHLPGGAAQAPPTGSSGGQGKPLLFARAEQLARGVAAAAKQAAAQAAGDPRTSGVDVEKLALKCALMSLQVPVDLLADAILRAL